MVNREELKEYQAIPHGGLKIIFCILTTSLIIAIYLRFGIDGAMAVMVFTVIIFWIIVKDLINNDSALRNYWRRNVIGYKMYLFRQPYSPTILITKRNESPPFDIFTDQRSVMFIVSLGGWFHRSVITSPNSTKWQIELVKIDALSAIRVRLRHPDGNSLILTAESALTLLTNYSNGALLPLGGIIGAARAQAAEQKERLDLALDAMEKTVASLDDTRRFIKSKEAQGIRQRLTEGLLRVLPNDDPRRQKYQAAA